MMMTTKNAVLLALILALPAGALAQSAPLVTPPPVARTRSTAPVVASTSDRVAQAVAARDAGRHDEALRLFQTLVDDPDPSVSALAHEGTAQLLSWRRDYDAAIDHYRRARELSPEKRRDATMGIARTLGWSNRSAEGLAELQPLLQESPNDVELRVLEGQIAMWGQLPDRSRQAYQRALELDPRSDDARTGLAKVTAIAASMRLAEAVTARDAGRTQDAIAIYRTLVNDADMDVRVAALEDAAALLSYRREYDEAIDYYRKLRELAPDRRRSATVGLARTLGWARHHQDGLDELAPLLAEDPDDTSLLVLKAQIAGWGGYHKLAAHTFQRVLELDPENQDAMLGRAKVLSWGGRLTEAEDRYEDLLERFPTYRDGLLGMSYTLTWLRRPNEARDYLERVAQEQRGGRDFRIAQTSVSWALGERSRAVKERKGLLRDFPGYPDVQDIWRYQVGALGPYLRGNATTLHDSDGLDVETYRARAAHPILNSTFVFGDAAREFLEIDSPTSTFSDAVDIWGGQLGLDWGARRAHLRGSAGSRRSNVNTGGFVGGANASFQVIRDMTFGVGIDRDFAFYTPRAVRNDPTMTELSVLASKSFSAEMGVDFEYRRTHYTTPDSGVPTPGVDQNRDWFNLLIDRQLGGFRTNRGSFRFNLGARGRYFTFDRQFPGVGYWNPRRYRQVQGRLGTQYRRSEELTILSEIALGVQSTDDESWRPALSLHGEFLRQLGRRWDLDGYADYSNSELARRSEGGGYRAWSGGLGFRVRLGDRTKKEKANTASPGSRSARR